MPWQISYAAYTEGDSDELQTDVMRFMAILAFCLVAIFAIVQSIPATPAPIAPQSPPAPALAPALAPATPAPDEQIPAAAVPVAAPELQRVRPRSAARATEPVRLHRALPRPVQPTPRPATVTAPPPAPVAQIPRDQPAPAASEPTEAGLSLRFESDAVLRSLVARGLVDLYAISDGTFYEMTVSGAGVRFQPGAAPAQYHEMIAATVPYEVRRSFTARTAGVTWGVTLPASTAQQLARFVKTRYNGRLVITADAQLTLASQGGA